MKINKFHRIKVIKSDASLDFANDVNNFIKEDNYESIQNIVYFSDSSYYHFNAIITYIIKKD